MKIQVAARDYADKPVIGSHIGVEAIAKVIAKEYGKELESLCGLVLI